MNLLSLCLKISLERCAVPCNRSRTRRVLGDVYVTVLRILAPRCR
jgi:hypothetical protein